MRAIPVATLLFTMLAGCIDPEPEIEISHVHGIAHDGESVYIATHNGLVRGPDPWTYIGDPYDYMGFTQDAEVPGTFYSSGHPNDPYSFGATHLGLRRSVDGGETWEQRSLKGEVDFHALTSIPGAGGWLAGYWDGQIKVSTDGGANWTDHPAPPAHVVALAATSDRLLAGTTGGLHEADLDGFGWSPVETAGLPNFMAALVASRDGQTLFASAGDGQTVSAYRSLDGGASWSELAPNALRNQAAPVYFAIDPTDADHVFATTAAAHVLESHDGGESWTTIRRA